MEAADVRNESGDEILDLRGVPRHEGLYGFEFRERDKRRNPDGQPNAYEIKQLWQRSHEIIGLAVRGFKEPDIASILNINVRTVQNTLNSELGQRKMSEMRLERDVETKKVSEKIRVLTDKALNIYHEIFDDESGEIGLKDKGNFAEGFLKEMSGLRAPTRIQSMSAHFQVTKDEIEEFKSRGLQAARESGLIVNVSPEQDVGKASKPAED